MCIPCVLHYGGMEHRGEKANKSNRERHTEHGKLQNRSHISNVFLEAAN